MKRNIFIDPVTDFGMNETSTKTIEIKLMEELCFTNKLQLYKLSKL